MSINNVLSSNKESIIYYEDKDLKITFSSYPKVAMRYPLPSDTKDEKKEKLSKPFICKLPLDVEIVSKNKFFSFTIPKNYTWDGASIPRTYWRLIGAKTDPKFLIPSLIHDNLCEHHEYIAHDRYLSTKVFERLLYVSGVNAINRWMIFHSVDNYQKIIGRW